MATTTKKGSKSKKARRRRPAVKTSVAEQAQTMAQLRQQLAESLQRENATVKELQDRNRQLSEALEQQTATREILRVISSSPTDLQAVLDAVAVNAALLCDAADAVVYRVDGYTMHPVAIHGTLRASPLPLNRGSVTGRAVTDRQEIHVYQEVTDLDAEFPESTTRERQRGLLTRTRLAVPLLREGAPLGAILIRRVESRPFSDKQIALLKTFADQAVIAIENARLLQERETRNRDLPALHDVTAAASQSLEIKPVLDEVVKKITEIFAFDSVSVYLFDPRREYLNSVASFGTHEEAPLPRVFRRGQGLTGRVAETGEPILFENVQTDPRYQELSQTKATRQRDYCFFAIFPIKSKQRFLGTINCVGKQPRQLIAEEIRLIRSMCDQIGVAVENINLFEEVRNKTAELESSNAELREALEHQTATAEVLGIISGSPTDVQPVLDAIVESAAKVCGIDDVVLRLREGNVLVSRAHFGPLPVPASRIEISIEAPQYRWMREHGTLHVPDISKWNDFQVVSAGGWRSRLTTPLYQQGEIVGILNARRNEVRPFTPAQIKLLETFADQAVIALENARLFNELKESLEQQTATSEILGVIASSPTDIQPVLDVVAENAARLCDATDAVIHRIDGDKLRPVANYGPLPGRGGLESIPIDRDHIPARAIIDRQTLHIDDLAAVPEDDLT